MPRRYPPEFRRKVLDLVASGRRVAQIRSSATGTPETVELLEDHRTDNG